MERTGHAAEFPGYRLEECLHSGVKSTVYRALRLADGRRVVLKIPQLRGDRPQRLAELQHEQRLVALLPPEVAAQVLGIEVGEAAIGLVREDFGAIPLREYVGDVLPVADLLELGARLADLLVALHARGIVHKDINPLNILIAPADGRLRLTDFSYATLLTHEPSATSTGAVLVGTLAYIAPEQTGRMNRGVDPRADLYALGVTLYELLLGRRPFVADDPLDLIHAHIAQRPEPAHAIDPRVPRALAGVLARLLEKDPDARYQSAAGLAADLRACARALAERGEIPDDLALGGDDRPQRFALPDRLYGRSDERAELLARFHRAAEGTCQVVLIAGAPGVGKSSLVQELQAPIVAARGRYAAVKFDRLGRHLAFASLLRTFGGLVEPILRGDPEQRESWRRTLRLELGTTATALLEAIPEVARLLDGAARTPPAGAPPEGQKLVESAIVRFVGAFAAEHPLVLFLDDLQWADSATLRVVEALVRHAERLNLLLIGAYRDAEIDAGHPLAGLVARLAEEAVPTARLHLGPLPRDSVRALVGGALSVEPAEVEALADAVDERARGNPFFVREYLLSLWREGLIAYSPSRARWLWDLAKIADAGLPDDVVELLREQLRGLPPEALRVLQRAACLGDRFDTRRLAAVHSAPAAAILRALWLGIERDLLVPLDASYRLLLEDASDPAADGGVPLRFLHDRVRQAIYETLTGDEREALHLEIGQRLLAAARAAGELDAALFEVAGHLNRALRLVVGDDARRELAALNLEAGRRARAATAYDAARAHLEVAARAAPRRPEDEASRLEIDLERAEVGHLLGDRDAARALLADLKGRAARPRHRAAVWTLDAAILAAQGRPLDALAVASEGLRGLGVEIPAGDEALLEAGARERAAIRQRLAGSDPDALAGAPRLEDELIRARLRLLASMLAPANLTHPALFGYVVAAQAAISVAHGPAEESVYGYVVYGYHLATSIGLVAEGHAFGRLALALVSRFAALEQAAITRFVFGSYLHLFRPLPEVVECLARAHDVALETGDYIALSYSCSHLLIARFSLDVPLARLHAEAQRFLALMKRTRVASSAAVQTVSCQLAACLRGHTRGPTSLSDVAFDEDAFVASIRASGVNFAINWHRLARLILCCLYEEQDEALALVAAHDASESAATEFYFITLFSLYACVALGAAATDAEGDARARRLEAFAAHRRKLERWEGLSPAIYRPMSTLADAEWRRLHGDPGAIDLYDRAIEQARAAGFLGHEALFNELAARFHLRAGRRRVASAYLFEAVALYRAWGAERKAERLGERHAGLLAPFDLHAVAPRAAAVERLAMDTATSTQVGHTTLDLMSVLRAAEAFSAEVQLGRMIQSIMHIVVTSAGAERGALVLLRGEARQVAALARGADRCELPDALDLAACDALPRGLVAAALGQSGAIVVPNAAAGHPALAADGDYVARVRPRSVLCMPIRHQGRALGALYLENNLVHGAFTTGRLELLRLLSTQMAISLKNALFYEQISAARAAAESANRAKSAFLANMSHELRTPLNAIIGYSEMVRDELADAGHGGAAADIERVLWSARHLLDIISSILDLSKIEAEQVRVSASAFDVRVFLDEVAASALPMAAARRDRLVVVCPPEVGAFVSDPIKLRQILLNLLSNAVKFTEGGEVRLVAASAGGALHLAVSDTGIGMSADQVERIFEPFFQVDDSPTRQYGGVGLGLAITRRLCELLGGAVSVESSPGAGSTFRVVLPPLAPA